VNEPNPLQMGSALASGDTLVGHELDSVTGFWLKMPKNLETLLKR